MSADGDLRAWHIPQAPGAVFPVNVSSLPEARRMLTALADYDLFQLRHRIKPDYCNAQGLEVYEGGGWSEWEDEEGDNVGDLPEVRP